MLHFEDGDIIITEHFAVKVTKIGCGWFAEVADSSHPLEEITEEADAEHHPEARKLARPKIR